jgi:organic hydroperoxide reductase OsmC/OhrA
MCGKNASNRKVLNIRGSVQIKTIKSTTFIPLIKLANGICLIANKYTTSI